MAAAYTLAEVEAPFADVERCSPGGSAASSSSSSSSSKRSKPSFGLKHVAAGLLGGAALAASGATLHSMTQQKHTDDVTLSARMLFESPDVHDVVANNVVNLASATSPKMHHSKEEVHQMVASTFKKLTNLLKEHDPETLDALENTKVSQEQHIALAHMLAYLSDPRVMDLGLTAAKALREAKTDDPEALRQAVLKKLSKKAKQIEDLHSEAVGKSLFNIADKEGEGFKSLLLSEHGPKKVALLASLGDNWYSKLDLDKKLEQKQDKETKSVIASRRLVGAPPPSYLQPHVSAPYQKAEEAVGIISTVLAEADVLTRIINPLCKIMPHGKDLHIPPMVTSILGASDFASELASCELDGMADKNPEEMIGCPMMSASAGFDMLREPCTLAGICGDNNPKNGRQGNHAGGKVHEGVLDDGARGKSFKKSEYKYPMCALFGTCHKKPPSSSSTEKTTTSSATTAESTTTTEYTFTTTPWATTESTTTKLATADSTTTEASTTKSVTADSTTTEYTFTTTPWATTESSTTESAAIDFTTAASGTTESTTTIAAADATETTTVV